MSFLSGVGNLFSAKAAIPSGTGISVVIPVYNAELHLIDAIDSVYAQGLNTDQFEILVIDDKHAADAPVREEHHKRAFRELDRRIQQGDYPNLRVLPSGSNFQNNGQSKAKNTGIKAARFPYIACLDADDMYVYDPVYLGHEGSFLEHGVNILNRNPNVAFVDCNFFEYQNKYARRISLTSEQVHERMVQFRTMSNKAIFRRSDAFNDHISGFDETLRKREDFHFFIKLLNARILRELPTEITELPQAFYLYRQHPEGHDNVSRSKMDNTAFARKIAQECLPYFQSRLGNLSPEQVFEHLIREIYQQEIIAFERKTAIRGIEAPCARRMCLDYHNLS